MPIAKGDQRVSAPLAPKSQMAVRCHMGIWNSNRVLCKCSKVLSTEPSLRPLSTLLSATKSGVHWFEGRAGWPATPTDPPVSASPEPTLRHMAVFMWVLRGLIPAVTLTR